LNVPAKKPFYRTRKFRRLFLILLIIGFILYSVGSIFAANYLTTSPSRSLGLYTPKDVGLKYEEISVQSPADDKITLRGWWIPNSKSDRVLILSHVKNGTRSVFLPLFKPLSDAGYNLLAYDMRGQGLSDGDHYTYGQKEQQDLLGVVSFVKGKGFAPGKIGALGWSMGAATSLLAMGATPDIKATVSDSAYGDFSQAINSRFSSITKLPPFFMSGILVAGNIFYGVDVAKVKPAEAIKNIGNRHVFIIHCTEDDNVPVSEAYRLKEAGGASISEFWILPGLKHVGAFEAYPAEYIRRVVAFFDKELG
jgi:dipeptidyl aminopeptidase/acylaminoacyl peptidase